MRFGNCGPVCAFRYDRNVWPCLLYCSINVQESFSVKLRQCYFCYCRNNSVLLISPLIVNLDDGGATSKEEAPTDENSEL